MSRLQRLLPAPDLFGDVGGGCGPDERLGMVVVLGKVAVDGDLEASDALEDATPDTLAGDLGEEPPDQVEPGGRGRREMQVKARVRASQSFTAGCL